MAHTVLDTPHVRHTYARLSAARAAGSLLSYNVLI